MAHVVNVNQRLAPLQRVVEGATGADRDIAALWTRILDQRMVGQRSVAELLARRRGLPPGLTTKQAAVSPADVADLQFVLADAIYFNASWKYQFQAAATYNGPFFRADGSQLSAALMQSELLTLPIHIGNGITEVEMPYVGGHFAADVFMPAPN